MNNSLFYQALLLGAAALVAGCSQNEDLVTKNSPPEQQVWSVSAQATRDSITQDAEDITRSLYFGGNNGDRYSIIWDTGDNVSVYKGETYLGILSPATNGSASTTLTGTLSGDISVGDILTLYLPARDLSFDGQLGTIASLSSGYMFQKATTTVTAALPAGNTLNLGNVVASTLTLGDINMSHTQTYIRFRLTDASTGARIHPTKFQFFAAHGQLVKTKNLEGTTVYYDNENPYTINPPIQDGEYPGELYLAVLNDYGAADSYRIKVWEGEDIYVGPTDRAMTRISNNGVLGTLARTMTKTKPVATTLAITAIPDRVFTGSAHEPVLEVKDGETTLTLDADYSVAYTDNVNVGTATATITGLAEQGATCTTPYLGTQDKPFNIVQAVPVITMPTTVDMTLEVGLTRNRAVTSVTLDNSAYGIADLDIMAAPYNCTVTYTSDDESVASVAADGTVTGVATGTTTIHVNVASAANWTSQTTSYVVKVSPRVNTSGNASWTVTEDAEDGNLYQ